MFYNSTPENNTLSAEESRHCTKVLRKKAGDRITIFDGKGNSFQAVLNETGKKCTYQIVETEHHSPKKTKVHIAIAPPKKAARLDFMVEKLIELGIQKIYFLDTQHSERSRLNLERLNKQIISACKQSKQYYIPTIVHNCTIQQLIDLQAELFVCHCDPNIPKQSIQDIQHAASNSIWMIGPEGDFSAAELEKLKKSNAHFIDLGPQRLRTETAAIYVMAVLKYLKD